MTDSAMADPSWDPASIAGDEFDGLPIPPMDDTFFAQGMDVPGSGPIEYDADYFDFDDLLDPAQLNDECFELGGSDPTSSCFQPDLTPYDVSRAFKTTSPEFPHNVSANGVVANSSSPEPEVCLPAGDRGQDVSHYLNVSSPESDGSKGSNRSRVLSCPSPESQVSGNCPSNVSGDSNKPVLSSSLNLSVKDRDVDSNDKTGILKRKKESDDDSDSNCKFHKSISSACNEVNSGNNNSVLSEEEEKKRARLMRNRESAQLSRQRKKHYVEELEDKVKSMHSTIQDLNTRISCCMAENAALRQQMLGASGAPAPMPGAPPPGIYPHPPPGMYAYPWMMPPYEVPYMMMPQGSKVPVVPIPRLRPQQAASAPRVSKKAEGKKSEAKTKKVASISFLGLLFFMMLFGGLVPMMNVRFGSFNTTFRGGPDYVADQFYEKHRARVLTSENGGNTSGTDFGEKGKQQNGSEPLVASLYVPRNDRMVKIDGNLIIHSVLASEKAMASRGDPANKAGAETSIAVSRDWAPVVPVSGGRPPHLYRNPSERQRALGSSSMGSENLKSSSTDGRLQQWFREGLAGPMLSSGMCTEVFQFDVSAASGPGAIVPVPASSGRNVTVEHGRNSTHSKKEGNRRILRGLPATLPGSMHNISKDGGRNAQEENFNGNNSLSPMVVSVLVDPREIGDADVDGVMGTKSLSRIFVVVLIDSVKYVTYSCMLPFKGAGPHLVTT